MSHMNNNTNNNHGNNQNNINRVHNDSNTNQVNKNSENVIKNRRDNNSRNSQNFVPKSRIVNKNLGLNDLKKSNAANNILNKMGPKGKIAAKALDSLSKNNGNSNIPKALQNKKNNFGINKFFSPKGIGDNEEVEENESYENEEVEDSGISLDNTISTISFFIKYWPVISVIGVIAFIVIFLLIIGEEISVTNSFSNLGNNGKYVYSENEPQKLAAEMEYYEKMDETIDFYASNLGVKIDKYLLHSTISYRYFNKSIEDLFMSDSGIDENDLEEVLGNIKNTVEYTDATMKIGVVAALMVRDNGDGTYTTDTEKNGIFYTNLLNSNFLLKYYSDYLRDDKLENKRELVDNIFDFAEYARSLLTSFGANNYIFDGMKIYLQTCAFESNYTYKEIDDFKVYNNPLTNEGTNYPSYLSMTDYVKGVLMGEVGGYINENNREGLKVMATVALSYIIRDRRSGFDLQNGELYFPTGNCRQVACDPNNGCTYITGKTPGIYGTAFVGVGRFGDEGGQHYPLSEKKQELLNEILSEVFGNILVKKGITTTNFSGSSDMAAVQHYASLDINGCVPGKCVGQINVMEDAKNGMKYEEILAKYLYDLDYDIINIKEGLYVEESEYADGTYTGDVIFYDQNDYKVSFCGRNDTTISKAGCGVTAAAIVASTLTRNSNYTPLYMNDIAKEGKYCGPGIDGTIDSFFKKVADLNGFKYMKTGDGGEVISALKEGNSLVIAHMGKGNFTNGGHYIVLSATNSNGQVYVHDPNNRRNKEDRGSGNGWYDINLIVDQLKASFHIITKG